MAVFLPDRLIESELVGRSVLGTPRRIVIATAGSLGDLHPCVGLALELKRRGHAVTIASTEFYRSKIEKLGLLFKAVRPDFDPTDGELIAKCQDIRRGAEVLIRELVLPHLEDSYADLLRAAADADLMLASELMYAVPLVSEKLSLPWASVILSPSSFLSAYDPSLLAPMPALMHLRKAGWLVNRALLNLASATTYSWWSPVRELRLKEGLGPGGNPLTEAKFSPDLVLALFSRCLAEAQPDWPPSTVQPGFVFYDQATEGNPLSDEMEAFLGAGDPPIVFTQGSAAVHHPGEFYEVSVEAARQIGKRALLIGAIASPRLDGPDVYAAPYAPYSQVFQRAALIVHQGGSGTTGHAMRSGRPMLIVPFGWDQPDNGARIERAGAGLMLSRKQYSADAAARMMRRLIMEPGYAKRAAEFAARMQGEHAVTSACDAIEDVLSRKRHGNTR